MQTETLRFDLPVMSAAALLLLVMAWDGVLSRTEGVIMILGAVLYAGRSWSGPAANPRP